MWWYYVSMWLLLPWWTWFWHDKIKVLLEIIYDMVTVSTCDNRLWPKTKRERRYTSNSITCNFKSFPIELDIYSDIGTQHGMCMNPTKHHTEYNSSVKTDHYHDRTRITREAFYSLVVPLQTQMPNLNWHLSHGIMCFTWKHELQSPLASPKAPHAPKISWEYALSYVDHVWLCHDEKYFYMMRLIVCQNHICMAMW